MAVSPKLGSIANIQASGSPCKEENLRPEPSRTIVVIAHAIEARTAIIRTRGRKRSVTRSISRLPPISTVALSRPIRDDLPPARMTPIGREVIRKYPL